MRRSSLSDKQGKATWQQFDNLRREQYRWAQESDPATEHQGNQSLKRKERASAEDWFEDRPRQKPKGPPEINFKFGQTNTTGPRAADSVNRDPRLPPSSEPKGLGEGITATHLTNAQFDQGYIHPQRVINLINSETADQGYIHPERAINHTNSETTDQGITGSTSSRMSHRPDAEPYVRRNYNGDGSRSPTRNSRGSYGSARRGSYPYRRPDRRRESFDRPPYHQRSPPGRRDEDFDRPRENREHRDWNEWVNPNITQTGSRGSGPGSVSPSQIRPPYPPIPPSQFSPQLSSSETADPRLTKRNDSITQSIPSVNPGAYPAVMDLATNNNEDGDPDIRSGSRTPLEPDAGPPCPKIEMQAVLLDFSTTVTELASFNIKREMAKKELDRQVKTFEHSRKHHASFPTLKEQQENNVVRARKDYQALEDKCKELEAGRDRAINVIGSAVGSGSSAGGGDSERARRFEKDVISIRGQLVTAHETQNRQLSFLSREISDLKSNQNQFAVNARTRKQGLDVRFEKIQNRIDDFPNLRLDVDKLREETLRILDMLDRHAKEAKDLREQAKDIRELKELKAIVEGRDGDLGLIQYLDRAEKNIDTLKVNMNAMDDDMEKINKDMVALRNRAASHEPKAKADSPPAKLAPSVTSGTPLSLDGSTLSKIQRDLLDFRSRLDVAVANFEQVLRDQKDRDEIVMQEMEGLSKSFQGYRVKVEAELRDVRAAHSGAVERVDSSISQLNKSISDLQSKANTAPIRVPDSTPATNNNQQVVGIGRVEYDADLHAHQAVLDQVYKNIDNVKQEVGALRHAFHHLDTRYNNVSTDQMARHMVGQLQQLYPQASNVQQEFDRIRGVHAALQEQVQDVSSKIEQLRGQPFGSEAFYGTLQQLQNDVSALKEARDRDASDIDLLNTRLAEQARNIGAAIEKNEALIMNVNSHLGIPNLD